VASVDLNLLVVLDALLQEGSVTGAARRLNLTPPAVSRALGRLRSITGDELLVRVGRNLVPTPAAERLRDPAHDAVLAAYEVLAPMQTPSDQELERSLNRVFTIRTGPDNASGFGPALLGAVHRRAPDVRLRFTADSDDAVEALRDGRTDLVLGSPIPARAETVHRETLFVDQPVIVSRSEGAFARDCGDEAPSVAALVEFGHVVREPESVWHDALDRQLAAAGLERTVVATAPGFAASFGLVVNCDLICIAPDRLTRPMLGHDLRSWPSPLPLPGLIIEQCWHHRSHTDPEHRWLRDRVREAVSATAS
jgi:DNA-binding transcriptional LysR family regulator